MSIDELVEARPDSPMSDDERLELATELEGRHRIFYTFWSLSDIIFTDTRCPTAMIMLPRIGSSTVYINRAFWASKSFVFRTFLICHECLHALLNHGMRNGQKEVPKATPAQVNIAQDITINHMIEDLFGITRYELDGWQEACWIDTVFQEKADLVLENQTFVYYLKMLAANNIAVDIGMLLDVHGEADDMSSENGVSDKLADQLADALDDNEELKNTLSQQAGQDSALGRAIIRRDKHRYLDVAKLIHKLKATSPKRVETDKQAFISPDRRFISLSTGLILPGTQPQRKISNGRLHTAIYMDVSGSCTSMLPKFYSIIEAFNREVETFDLTIALFDDRIHYPYRLGDQIPEGGGTSFNIIEAHLQSLVAQKKRYPDCVIVITDGYGNDVRPKIPERWIVMLEKGGKKTNFPKSCKFYDIDKVSA